MLIGMSKVDKERLLPLLSCSFHCFLALASALSFQFDGFGPARYDCARGSNAVCLQGNASMLPSEQFIQLTTNRVDKSLNTSVGRASYSEPLHLWTNISIRNNATVVAAANFTTEFSFAIDNLDRPNSGDGIAFFLAHYPSAIPVNSSGRCLGLLTEATDTNNIPNVTDSNGSFVAVEFDSFKNFYDFSSRHVGIDINSILSVQYFNLSRHFQGNITGAARVDYDGVAGNLSVQLEYAGVRYFMSRPVRLWEILPEWVSVGLSATTGQQIELHKIYSWKLNSSTLPGDDDNKKNNGTSSPTDNKGNGTRTSSGLVVGVTVAAVVSLVLGAAGSLLFLRRRKRKRAARGRENAELGFQTSSSEGHDPTIDEEIRRDEPGPRRFLYKELFLATAGFADDKKLGAGGFGDVYHGILSGDSCCTDVAIKKVSKDSRQGKKEYVSEIRIISRLRHRNLVQLLGWCHARGELMLVYEYMPNGSLDSHLHGATKGGDDSGLGAPVPPLMLWPARYKVALGLASALLYLHEEWHQCVLHRDIKPSNVMLDSDFEAKLGDFGLARLVGHGDGAALYTTALAGTRAYMAPECFFTSYRPGKESDVYSLGVVLLEMGSGRRPDDRRSQLAETEEGEVGDGVVGRVWKLYGKGALLEAADERLDNVYDKEQMERLLAVGLWCAHPDPKQRPNMKQVVGVLNFAAPPPDLPRRMPVIVCSYMLPPNVDLQYGSSPASTTLSGGTSAGGASLSIVTSSSSNSDKYVTTMRTPMETSTSISIDRNSLHSTAPISNIDNTTSPTHLLSSPIQK